MPGSPKKRAKREAATRTAVNRCNRRSVAERQDALRRAGEVGTVAAAAEVGVSPSTLRSWRKRLAGELLLEPTAAPVTGLVQSPPADGPADPADPISAAEARAREGWGAAAEAVGEMRAAVRRGDANAARALSVSFGVCSDKAEKAERLLLDMAERRPRIDDAVADLILQAHTAAMRALIRRHGLSPTLEREARGLVGQELRRLGADGEAGVGDADSDPGGSGHE